MLDTSQAQVDTSEGNTKLRSRKWVFTLNNYTDDELINIDTFLVSKCDKYIRGKEVGIEGTPHLQGYMEFKNARNFKYIKGIMPRAHLERARGTAIENLKYCKKDNDFITNIIMPYEEKLCPLITEFNEWQAELIDILQTEPDFRSIHVYVDYEGHKGKTSICRYLSRNNRINWIKTGTVDGSKHILMESKNCRDIAFDLPRGALPPYQLIEELKDGLLYSTKYEGGKKEIAIPHIIIFTNKYPNIDKLSKDRWIIKEI